MALYVNKALSSRKNYPTRTPFIQNRKAQPLFTPMPAYFSRAMLTFWEDSVWEKESKRQGNRLGIINHFPSKLTRNRLFFLENIRVTYQRMTAFVQIRRFLSPTLIYIAQSASALLFKKEKIVMIIYKVHNSKNFFRVASIKFLDLSQLSQLGSAQSKRGKSKKVFLRRLQSLQVRLFL